MQTGEIIIYQAQDGGTIIDVKLENDTVWLSQAQMVQLFGRSVSVISRHIKNIFEEGELDEKSNLHFLQIANSDRPVVAYSLDVIISVGYRVKSTCGTQFRIWANKVLKDYLVKGFSINEKRIQEQNEQFVQLKQTVKLLANVVKKQPLSYNEATGLLKVITDYTYALDVLDKYDHQALEIGATTSRELFQINYEEAMNAIQGLREKFGGSSLFGNEKDESFQGSLAAIYQTFGGQQLT